MREQCVPQLVDSWYDLMVCDGKTWLDFIVFDIENSIGGGWL